MLYYVLRNRGLNVSMKFDFFFTLLAKPKTVNQFKNSKLFFTFVPQKK